MLARLKSLLYGIFLILLIGLGGLVYRNAVEHPQEPIACPLDALVCPDGTAVSRTGTSCTFPACPLPNVVLTDIGVAFAVPDGFSSTTPPDAASVAAYLSAAGTSTEPSEIIIRRFAVPASSTPLSVIQATAIGGTSGVPVPATAFSSSMFGTHRFTRVTIERFEGVVHTAYYLARTTDVLRFDAIDRGVLNWTDPQLDPEKLPAQSALRKLLSTLQGE